MKEFIGMLCGGTVLLTAWLGAFSVCIWAAGEAGGLFFILLHPATFAYWVWRGETPE